MISKKTITVSIIILLSFLLIVLTAFSCFFLFAPKYIESKLIPSILSEQGIRISSLKVRSIGLNGAEISNIKIGKGQKESLNLDSIKIKYSLLGLLNRQVKIIELSGISLNLEYEKNRISISGLEEFLESERNKPEKDDTSSTPFTIKKLLIINSIISLMTNDENLNCPFELSTTSFNQYMLPEEFDLGLSPSGHKITVNGKIGTDNKIKVDLKTNQLPLDIFKAIANEVIPIDFKGKADIRIKANISPKLDIISDVSASLTLEQTIVNYSGITLKNLTTLENTEKTIDVSITSKDMTHWEYKVSPLFSDYANLPITLKLSGTADLLEVSQNTKVKVITKLFTIEETPAIQWDISLDRDKGTGAIKMQIDGKPNVLANNTSPFTAFYNNMVFSTLSPQVNAWVEYNKGAVSGSYLLKLKNIESNHGKKYFSAPTLSVKGDIRQEKDKKNSFLSSFSVESKASLFKDRDIIANIPEYRIKGIVQYDIEKGFNMEGQFFLKNGSLSMPDTQLGAKGINGKFPFDWPFKMTQRNGNFSIKKIKFKNQSLGPLTVVISLKGNDISFRGNVLYPLFPGMDIKLFGNTKLDTQMSHGKIRMDIPEYKSDSDIKMGKILPELDGYLLNGTFKADVEANLKKTKLESGLSLAVDQVNINNVAENLNLENISLNFKLNDLIDLISPSGQRLKIDKIVFNDIIVKDIIVDFKLDGAASLLIEHVSFKWCEGDINIPPFKVIPGKDDYDLILLCENLDLTKVLQQLGAVNAIGEGTLNGKIPLHYSKGRIIIKNGFLSSIPGQGGKIQIKNTEVLTSAIQQGTKESEQVEIVSEALKNFVYNSVKMDLDSDGDNLKMKIQLDGKPVNKLPFIYKKELGKFLRVASAKEGSVFKGFVIDLNFNVPFDRILNIMDELDMIK